MPFVSNTGTSSSLQNARVIGWLTACRDFHDEAVRLALRSRGSISRIAREFDVNPEILSSWVRRYERIRGLRSRMENSFPGKSRCVLREGSPVASRDFIGTMRLDTAENAYLVGFVCSRLGVFRSGYEGDSGQIQQRHDAVRNKSCWSRRSSPCHTAPTGTGESASSSCAGDAPRDRSSPAVSCVTGLVPCQPWPKRCSLTRPRPAPYRTWCNATSSPRPRK
ncbi:helix-turn-helix domain-containing protein [Streptomyces sp. ACA25]|uniref:helix-turn-helix domain-containing protein n=1 Tax=Streptomyces sp. ACA25 TaxID=3022596 RepID=UPI003FA74015